MAHCHSAQRSTEEQAAQYRPPDAPELARRALGLWQIVSLGREPLYDRGTPAYRVNLANNYMDQANAFAAIALLQQLRRGGPSPTRRATR